MKNIFLLIVFVNTTLLFSCSSLKNVTNENVDGYYSAKVKKHGFTSLYTLVLNKDNTFSFNIKVHGGNPKCNGIWKIIDNNLLLECEEVDVYEALTSGYMSKRENIMHVINKNKLKYNDIILKRRSE